MMALEGTEGKMAFSVSGVGSSGNLYGEKNESWPLPHPIHKNQFQIDCKSTYAM